MDFLNDRSLDKIAEFENNAMNFFKLIYKEQQFGNVLLTDNRYEEFYPISYRGVNKGKFLWDLFEIYPSTKGYIVEESVHYKEITRVSFDSSTISRILIKRGLLKLCPFRKKRIASNTCHESSHYEEEFLPCYEEKCMLYNDKAECNYGIIHGIGSL